MVTLFSVFGLSRLCHSRGARCTGFTFWTTTITSCQQLAFYHLYHFVDYGELSELTSFTLWTYASLWRSHNSLKWWTCIMNVIKLKVRVADPHIYINSKTLTSSKHLHFSHTTRLSDVSSEKITTVTKLPVTSNLILQICTTTNN